jgi:4-amino-4-deoxy-L-arabinose transferase-like glycosyltransferase
VPGLGVSPVAQEAQQRHRDATARGVIVVGTPSQENPVHTSTLPTPRRAAAPPPAPERDRTETPSRPRWERPALLALLAGTALLYLWDLSASGYANDFYAAAVQAGTQSWKAWLFGSLDSGNAITVDKPPAALWVMVASARLFGFTSWSLLVPQALMGVASVALLRAAVRRWAGPGAGLLAGTVLALTPAAVLMFRFDNPDALLVLLLVAGAYATVRAIDAASVRASTWWLVAAGAAVGFGFLTKMGQALLVVPAFGLAYLVAGPTRPVTPPADRRLASLRRRSAGHASARLLQLLAALGSMIVSAGWFVALVEMWTADSRPYIGGSTTNSLLELALGYNGLGRLLGGSGNGGGGFGGANSGFGGAAGIIRLFTDELGLEISWLLPAALVALVALAVVSWRAPLPEGRDRGSDEDPSRSAAGPVLVPPCHRLRAAVLLWGGWTLVTGLVFSFMSGTMHPYYTVALAPGIAALVGVGAAALWTRRASLVARGALALMVAATAAWSFVLLAGSTESFTWLRWAVVAVAVPAVVGLLVGAGRQSSHRGPAVWRRRLLGQPLGRAATVGIVAALLTGLAGTSAYAVATASVAHTGSIPSVGTSSGMTGGPGGGGERPALPSGASTEAGTIDTGTTDAAPADGPAADGGQPQGGGMGVSANSELTALLTATDGTWSAAVSSSQSAASLELASGTAVMSTGGWGGSDAAVTLEQFQAHVADGQITYYAGGGQGGGPGGDSDSTSSQIAAWVAANYTATTVGGQTVYDLQA